jgi:predicted RecB family nuclease/transcriptional regulator with XRE-family HTH domain
MNTTSNPQAGPAARTLSSFGVLVIDRADERDLTPSALAERVGVSRSAVWRWTTGQYRPSPQHLTRLARVLRVPKRVLDAALDADRVVAALPDEAEFTYTRVDGETTSVVVDLRQKPKGGYAAKTCPVKIYKDEDPVNYPPELKDPLSASVLARMEAGNVFEDEVGTYLAHHVPATDLTVLTGDRTPASLRAREQATLAAMRRGALVIWNARFPVDHTNLRTGEPDLLVRAGRNSAGRWAYVPVDVKHHVPLAKGRKPSDWLVSPLSEPYLDTAEWTELGGYPHKVDALQLAHYVHMLAELGHATGRHLAGIVGKPVNGELCVVWMDLAELTFTKTDSGSRQRFTAWDLYIDEFSRRLRIASVARARRHDPTVLLPVRPERRADCSECEWKTNCHDEMVAADDITLVQGVTVAEAIPHRQLGIHTSAQLATLDTPTAMLIDAKVDVTNLVRDIEVGRVGRSTPLVELLDGAADETVIASLADHGFVTAGDLSRLDLVTARYQHTDVRNLVTAIDQARVQRAQRVHRARGVTDIGLRRFDVEIDVDMENDEDSIYLWGTYTVIRARNAQIPDWVRVGYQPFVSFDGTVASEATVFAGFWDYLNRVRAWAADAGLSYGVFHYTAAELRCVRHIVNSHAGAAGIPSMEEAERVMADTWHDLHLVVSRKLLWPTESLTLKAVASNIRFCWRDESPSGLDSVLWYRDAVSHPDPVVREENRARVLEYNEDDVLAELAVRDFLTRLGQTRDPNRRLPAVETLDRRFGRRRGNAA